MPGYPRCDVWLAALTPTEAVGFKEHGWAAPTRDPSADALALESILSRPEATHSKVCAGGCAARPAITPHHASTIRT